ncbi:hypothetical protein CYMTET_8816 [Cymbomonas tetramitiformis]|uniref:Uncharacterized protein n=1 Tax=Cymbomonas tetramitiformis TaxID=36881 RepID=A0AAE0GSP4_9CHLO|nr:hypothetical protein CYMTET_8816 [Cymbomonas tetramitiformis]
MTSRLLESMEGVWQEAEHLRIAGGTRLNEIPDLQQEQIVKIAASVQTLVQGWPDELKEAVRRCGNATKADAGPLRLEGGDATDKEVDWSHADGQKRLPPLNTRKQGIRQMRRSAPGYSCIERVHLSPTVRKSRLMPVRSQIDPRRLTSHTALSLPAPGVHCEIPCGSPFEAESIDLDDDEIDDDKPFAGNKRTLDHRPPPALLCDSPTLQEESSLLTFQTPPELTLTAFHSIGDFRSLDSPGPLSVGDKQPTRPPHPSRPPRLSLPHHTRRQLPWTARHPSLRPLELPSPSIPVVHTLTDNLLSSCHSEPKLSHHFCLSDPHPIRHREDESSGLLPEGGSSVINLQSRAPSLRLKQLENGFDRQVKKERNQAALESYLTCSNALPQQERTDPQPHKMTSIKQPHLSLEKASDILNMKLNSLRFAKRALEHD